jgi:hypothetical protein
MKKRKKKLPWSKHQSINNRFLDLRFSGIENAINAQDNLKHKKERKKLKDTFQTVYGSTHFSIVKNKPNTEIEYFEDDDTFQDTYNNYEKDYNYTGVAYLKMWRYYRGKKYYYLISMQDISEQEEKDFNK